MRAGKKGQGEGVIKLQIQACITKIYNIKSSTHVDSTKHSGQPHILTVST